MGQYFKVVNTTKKEYINPHKMDDGVKFLEFFSGIVPQALCYLLHSSDAASSEYNGEAWKNLGRWAGDTIVITGDYDLPGKNIPEEDKDPDDADQTLYEVATDSYKEIGAEILDEVQRFSKL